MCHYQASQHVLYHIFSYEKKYRIDDVAEAIGISVNTLTKYKVGVSACPVEVLKKIYVVTRHPMIRELLEPEGHMLVPDDSPDQIKLLPSVDAHVVEAMAKIVDLKRAFEKAFEDGVISPQEYSDLKILKGEAVDAVNLILSRIAAMIESRQRQRKVRAA